VQENVIYDKAAYHTSGDFPDDVDPDQAYVPTGLFLAWVALKGLLNTETNAQWGREIEALKARLLSPSSFFRTIGGVFEQSLLTDDGRLFTQEYFDFDNGAYLDDLDDVLAASLPSLFHIADTWENFDELARRIEDRFTKWKPRPRVVRD